MNNRNEQVRTGETRIHVTPWLVTRFYVAIEHGNPRIPINSNSGLGTASPKENKRWCSATSGKGRKMKQLIRLTLNTLVAVGLMILVVGCNKAYKTIIVPEENISQSSAVEIDGRANAGKIRRIYVDASGQRVAEFTTGSEPLRQGTIRVRGNGVIALRTKNATAQALETGAFIPVESSLTFVAKKWGTSALAILAVAAVAAVICLRRFLAFRAAAPFVPVLLAAGLALLTAYAVHGVVVPIVNDLVQRVQARSASSNVPATSNDSDSSVTGGWAAKARGVERDFVGFLRSPVDAPRLLAFVLTFVVTLPIFAWLISWFFRKLAPQPAICGLLLLVLVPSALTAEPAKTGVFFSRDFLKEEQRFCQQSLSEVERDLSAASHLLDANLTGAPTHLVRALFLSDIVSIRLEGEPDRITQLKSSFGYVRTEEQRKFNANYAGLRQQLQTAQLDAAKLAERCNAVTNSPTILQLYQAKQAEYRNLIRAGLADVRTVLEECNRLALQAAQRKKELKPVEGENTVSNLARLQREQSELQAQVSELRRTQQNTNHAVPRPIIVTNTIVERLVPGRAPAPIVITNKERVFITNTVVVTNPVLHANADNSSLGPRLVTNSAPPSSVASIKVSAQKPPGVSESSDMTGKSKTASPNTNWILVAGKAALPWIGLICICGLCAGIYAFLAAARTGTVQLAVDGKVLEPIEITSNEDAITLEAQPLVKALADVADKAHLSATWRGTILEPGQQTVTINELPATKARRIKRGDTIKVQNGGAVFHQFDFLGWDRNSTTAEA